MKDLDSFVPWVAPYAPGASDVLIKQYVIEACIDFCSRTNVVQTVEPQDLVADQSEYDVAAPSQQTLVRVLSVFINALPLSAVSIDSVEHGAAARAGVDTIVESPTGTPVSYYQITPTDDVIYLWPKPDTTINEGIAIRASFAPARSARQVEDTLYDDYVHQITMGALSRMLVIPGQAFTNPQAASGYAREYEAAVASVAGASKVGSVRSSLRVRPRPFA